MPHYPKRLPWLAKRYGLSEARLREIWDAALIHASVTEGVEPSPAYWTSANRYLSRQIERESLLCRQEAVLPLAGVRGWLDLMSSAAANSASWSLLGVSLKLAGAGRRH